MSREQLLSNLGTIARSGTRKFMEAMAAKGDTNLIGQFGVGFYSAFLVADRVMVQSKSPEEAKHWVWEAKAGSHQYSIREDEAKDLVRGTRWVTAAAARGWGWGNAAGVGVGGGVGWWGREGRRAEREEAGGGVRVGEPGLRRFATTSCLRHPCTYRPPRLPTWLAASRCT